MKVKGVGWLGSPTARYAEMRRFAVNVLGLTPRIDQEDFAVFDLPDGDVFEVFGPKAIAQDHEFMRAPPLLSITRATKSSNSGASSRTCRASCNTWYRWSGSIQSARIGSPMVPWTAPWNGTPR